jgi:hypothetical protein
LPGSALGLLVCRGGESASESDVRTFDGIVLRDALTGVRDRGNEAGRDVDLSRTAVSVVERKVSFSFSRTRGGGNVLTSSSPLSVVESTAARLSVGGGPGLCRAALVTDSSAEPLVSLGGLFTSKLWEACVSWDVRPLPAAESTEGKSSCGLSGWSVIGAGRVGLVESEDRTRQQHTGVGIKGKKSGYATEARTYARLREYVPDMSIHATACRSANTIDRLPRGVQ